MRESKTLCVKSLTVKEGGVLLFKTDLVWGVYFIAKQRMPDVSHMNSYLMSSSGFESAPYVAYIAVSFKHLVMSHSFLCVRGGIGEDCHLLSVDRMPAYRGVDSTRVAFKTTAPKRALILVLSQIEMQKMNNTAQKIEYINAKNNFCKPNFNLGIYICYILFYN